MHGRSDGVLNPGGIRFGSAEIYKVVAQDLTIADSVCVGQRRDHEADESVMLFVQMAQGHDFDRAVTRRLKDTIRSSLSPRHVPKYIFPVPGIPYTVNGKKVEILIKKLVSGHDIKVSPTIVNPEILDSYKQFIQVEEVSERQQLLWDSQSAHL